MFLGTQQIGKKKDLTGNRALTSTNLSEENLTHYSSSCNRFNKINVLDASEKLFINKAPFISRAAFDLMDCSPTRSLLICTFVSQHRDRLARISWVTLYNHYKRGYKTCQSLCVCGKFVYVYAGVGERGERVRGLEYFLSAWAFLSDRYQELLDNEKGERYYSRDRLTQKKKQDTKYFG